MNEIIAFIPQVLEGLKVTIEIFIITLILSIPLGCIIALGRISKVKILNSITEVYVLILRGTPLLLQILFIFFGLPLINISIPRFPAAILAMVLNYGAYFGEIFRAGIISIDKGQFEGAEVLGLSKKDTFFRIIMPQALKRIFPPVANEIVTLVKDTALVYVVGLDELLKVAKIASNRLSSIMPFVVIGVVYLLFNSLITKVLESIEKRFGYYQ
ncbi:MULTISPECIES: amino acid ABC transporter permease [Clostridium]|uniref:amino acid ABC transporter permease n=1 Tax=Clostridium TaxID=1485 RepID=UPI001156CE0A|nr:MULTISPECIES: amino acid ABC transporter permease [Clostridium]MBS6502968.1 amino acid ABC transporter permease [Clostridium sp.]MDB1932715.1 amino acid ABC transporter permease [Clostridium tertium]MDB1936777.1 amino acid ABC transporter permease [Clostridium tertium]MDB1944216.1 amino acid ABC transporter permease [Clostridium tertium]MDB1950520.1 amino acid ABC transporter permease [Clostridium tertium]